MVIRVPPVLGPKLGLKVAMVGPLRRYVSTMIWKATACVGFAVGALVGAVGAGVGLEVGARVGVRVGAIVGGAGGGGVRS